MLRGGIAILFFALSGSAGADWTPVAADNGIFSAHADHSERFGAGRVVSAANRPRPWENVVEGGIDDAYWKFACGEI
ncbi:MAG: hypothetical protein EPO19_02145 [Betaproteobacteria bacterium]|nr:MAG: hypothetical protein EPO19_02145 [Betaproteobacteria bacterium]